MADMKRERVLFHLVGQGSVEITYEDGVETPEQAFRSIFDTGYRNIALRDLLRASDDFDHVLTVATEPVEPQPGIYQTGGTIAWADGTTTEIPSRLIAAESADEAVRGNSAPTIRGLVCECGLLYVDPCPCGRDSEQFERVL